MTITHVLLDIEGTTCPVTFVSEVLFPYAREALFSFLEANAGDTEIQELVQQTDQAWSQDTHPEAIQQRKELTDARQITDVVPYLKGLIDRDIKLTALKDLQGRIWRSGYNRGELVAPLFDDVPAALKRWHQSGLTLAVYSSGSVPAQQLLYGHCHAGDLRALFSHWFDTRIGPKQDAESYAAIAQQMQVAPQNVLFISDAIAELEAADAIGMAVLFSDREGNPARECGRFERISDYSELDPADDSQRA
ncbi:MAG: acireductone synthase [Cyanobacteriota bacterium]|jgi:enolase-phosphatase E1